MKNENINMVEKLTEHSLLVSRVIYKGEYEKSQRIIVCIEFSFFNYIVGQHFI